MLVHHPNGPRYSRLGDDKEKKVRSSRKIQGKDDDVNWHRAKEVGLRLTGESKGK